MENKQGPSIPAFRNDFPDLLSEKGLLAYGKVFSALQQAEKKHQGWPGDIVHATAIMVEEAGEAMQAALNCYYHNGDKKKLIDELAQTGAMVLRCLIHLV